MATQIGCRCVVRPTTAPGHASRDLAVLHHRVPVTMRQETLSATRVNAHANDDAQLTLPITEEQRVAEEPKPKKAAVRKAASSGDDGQGNLF